MEQELEAMRQALVIRGYAQRTLQTYLRCVERYLRYEKKPISEVTPGDIQAWQYHLVNDKRASWTVLNQCVCALKFYFREVKNCSWSVDFVPHMKAKKRIPTVLSPEEITRMFAVITYPKHHAILATLYSTGIRLSELRELRVNDIVSVNLIHLAS